MLSGDCPKRNSSAPTAGVNCPDLPAFFRASPRPSVAALGLHGFTIRIRVSRRHGLGDAAATRLRVHHILAQGERRLAAQHTHAFFGENQPVAVFAVGHFFWSISPQVGLWLEISAVALYVNNHIIYYNERRALLDIRDAEIESKFMSAALSGKPARETAGFVVAESSIKLMNHDAGLKAAFENLSPELKAVLDANSQPASTAGAE